MTVIVVMKNDFVEMVLQDQSAAVRSKLPDVVKARIWEAADGSVAVDPAEGHGFRRVYWHWETHNVE